MKKLFFVLLLFTAKQFLYAQNIGIGTNTPGFPLNFSNALGDKISLWGNSGSHYGLGIQSGLFQIHSDAPLANIGFGYGSSNNFTERMRLINSGLEGMTLNGRLTIRNGDPSNTGGGGGVWLTRPDNSSLLGFMGTQNNQNIGFYGGPAGWGFTYDAINSRVGIGTNNPATRLDIGGLNNWDLINTEGDMRIGNSSYRLKMGVALSGGGTGAAGIMQSGGVGSLSLGAADKYLLQLNGAANFIDFTNVTGGIRLNNNAGSSGQVITSNGTSAAPSWKSATNDLYNKTVSIEGISNVTVSTNSIEDVPGFLYGFSVPGNAKVIVNYNILAYAPLCSFCGFSKIDISVNINGTDLDKNSFVLPNAEQMTLSGSAMFQVGGGTHNIKIRASVFASPAVSFGTIASSTFRNDMIVQVINE